VCLLTQPQVTENKDDIFTPSSACLALQLLSTNTRVPDV
jgi:hypothetical protein